MTTTDQPKFTHEVVKRNVATGGRVSRVSPVKHFDQWTAQSEADRRNEREGRAHKNVIWTVRSVERREWEAAQR
jgi:hypothetical protein